MAQRREWYITGYKASFVARRNVIALGTNLSRVFPVRFVGSINDLFHDFILTTKADRLAGGVTKGVILVITDLFNAEIRSITDTLRQHHLKFTTARVVGRPKQIQLIRELPHL